MDNAGREYQRYIPFVMACLFVFLSGCAQSLRFTTEIRAYGAAPSKLIEQAVTEMANDSGCTTRMIVPWVSGSTDELVIFAKPSDSSPGKYTAVEGTESPLTIEYYRFQRRIRIISHTRQPSPMFIAVRKDLVAKIKTIPKTDVSLVHMLIAPNDGACCIERGKRDFR
jgi:hypothetical protein